MPEHKSNKGDHYPCFKSEPPSFGGIAGPQIVKNDNIYCKCNNSGKKDDLGGFKDLGGKFGVKKYQY